LQTRSTVSRKRQDAAPFRAVGTNIPITQVPSYEVSQEWAVRCLWTNGYDVPGVADPDAAAKLRMRKTPKPVQMRAHELYRMAGLNSGEPASLADPIALAVAMGRRALGRSVARTEAWACPRNRTEIEELAMPNGPWNKNLLDLLAVAVASGQSVAEWAEQREIPELEERVVALEEKFRPKKTRAT
jgi:hypothetical protein